MSDATGDGGAHEASAMGVSDGDFDVTDRPRGKPGRRPKGSVPHVVADLPDKPDPDHVLTWRQRKVLQVIRESVLDAAIRPPCARSARQLG